MLKIIELRKSVENYKKMQLYSIDCISVESSIINDLIRDLEDGAGHTFCEVEKSNMIAKVIAYMEFGLPYEKNKSVLEKVLRICGISKKEVNELVDKEAMYVKATKTNMQKIIIWKSKSLSNEYMNKGTVIEDIVFKMKNKQIGEYCYSTDICKYELIIELDMAILRNVVRGIEYYLL